MRLGLIELRRVARHEDDGLGLFAAQLVEVGVGGVPQAHRVLGPLVVLTLAQRVVALGHKASQHWLVFGSVALEDRARPLHLLRCIVLGRRRLLFGGKYCRVTFGSRGEEVGAFATEAANEIREARVVLGSLWCAVDHQLLLLGRLEVVLRENLPVHAVLQLELVVHVFNLALLEVGEVVLAGLQLPALLQHRALREEALKVPLPYQDLLVVLRGRGGRRSRRGDRRRRLTGEILSNFCDRLSFSAGITIDDRNDN